MTALNTFVERHIPNDLRLGRDFTGPRGWVFLMNQVLRRLETEGLISFTQIKETGVEISNDFWITAPSDLRKPISVYYPPMNDAEEARRIYAFEMVNGKIKLIEPFYKKTAPDTFILSAGGLTSVKINDTDAVADEWERYLLVLTNGTYSGDQIIIGQHSAASAGLTTLDFLHARTTSISTSTSGYLTDEFLMLRYMATFAGLSAAGDTIPVDAKYEMALITGLCYLAKPIGSKERGSYREEFEYELDVLGREQNTPSPDQARPLPRPMAAFEDCSSFETKHDEFVGEFDE